MTALVDYSYDECSNMHYNLPMSNICDHEYNQLLVDELQTAYASLNENNTFGDFSLYPSVSELAALQDLHIDPIFSNEYSSSNGHAESINQYEYEKYGDLENISLGVKDYLDSLSSKNNNISAIVANFINKAVGSVIKSVDSETAIVIIRAYTPSNELYSPRWHVDDNIFGNNYSITIALKGASTLFYNESNDLRDEFISINDAVEDADDIKTRMNLNNLFDSSKADYSTEFGYGSTFLCGSEKNGAIHTHPAIYEDRIFMAIVPGSKVTIERFKDKIEKANEFMNDS